ncbi:MAG: hypothetical protein DLM64_13725 [Solirubrobacterales bacterium]|nr:MAG: hypothetical protein DLM64_13725 [Solirubrobacterales bacterium]
MPPGRDLQAGHSVIFPNRDKAASGATKAIVVVLLLVSVALMLIVTVGGWSKLQGQKPINFMWAIVYLLLAFYIGRWKRGLLPIAAALAILLLIVAAIAGTGAAGTGWFDRNHAGFASAQALFGGTGLDPDTLGLMTLLLAPVQALLIAFSMLGFSQGWNVELELPPGEAKLEGRRLPRDPRQPAAA